MTFPTSGHNATTVHARKTLEESKKPNEDALLMLVRELGNGDGGKIIQRAKGPLILDPLLLPNWNWEFHMFVNAFDITFHDMLMKMYEPRWYQLMFTPIVSSLSRKTIPQC